MGALDAGRKPRCTRCQPGEEPERTVDVQPGPVTLGEVGQLVNGVEVAGIHFAGVSDQDRGRAVETL